MTDSFLVLLLGIFFLAGFVAGILFTVAIVASDRENDK